MSENGVHTDPAAISDLTDAARAERSSVAPDGSKVGYKASRTLPVRVELVRQLRRRRTQLVLGFLVLLPFILVVAFELGQASPNTPSGVVVEQAPAR
ncbi:ABC transporter permease, partial [Actinosynnema sp. NPDC059335]